MWSMGVAALVPLVANAATCPTLNSGDLFKVANNSAVYLVNPDMKRMYFPNAEVYKTWYTDYSGVQVIDNTCVDNYPSGGGVNYRPGSRLVKTVISPNVYAVGPNNMKHKIASEAVAAALYGSGWAKLVRDLPDVFDANYSVGSEVSESKPHNGMLVTKAGDAKVYEVVDGELKEVDGTLSSVASGDVREVSAGVFASVSMASETVTSASVANNPSQMAGGASSGSSSPSSGSTGTLTVALASDTPAGTFAVKNAARVAFTKVNFTATGGDVTIDSLQVKRNGSPSIDGDFSKINMVDNEGLLVDTLGKTLNSDSIVNFGQDIVIPAGTTKSYTLVADMASGLAGGNYPKLALQSVTTDSTVVGTLPLVGNAVQTNASVVLGTATLSEGAQVGTVTEQIGDTGVNFANLDLQVATNDFQVEQLRLYNGGSADNDDVQNWKLTYQSNTVATGMMKDKYVTFDLSGCGDSCMIKKGATKSFSVYGDIVDGSTRTIDLDLRRTTDLLVKDLKYGYYATPTNSADELTNTVTVSQGKITVSKTNDVQAGNVPDNASGVELGSWNFKVQGEPVTVNTIVVKGTTVTGDPDEYDNIVLYTKDGKALTSGVDLTEVTSGGLVGYATSTDSFTLPVGDTVVIAKGNISSDASADDQVTLAIDMANTSNFDAEGSSSSETITLGTYALPQAVISANTLTVKSGALRITTLTTPAARTLAAGTNDVDVAHVLFDASGSSEDIKVTQVKVTDSTGSTAKTIDMQNIRIFVDKDGDSFDSSGTLEALGETNSGSNATANGEETFTYNLSGSDQFTIKAGKKVKAVFRADVAGGAVTGVNSNHTFAVSTTNWVTASGVTTGDTVTEVIDTAAGQTLTIGSAGGTVEVGLDASNPSARLFAAGTKGVELATFNFYATSTEDVELDKIYLTMNVTDTSSSSFSDYTRLYFEDDAGVIVGSTVPTSTKPLIEFDDGAFIVDIDNTSGHKLHLKADLSSIGTQQAVTVGGHRLGLKINNAGDITAKGAQSGSGTTEVIGASAPTGLTHYMYQALPTVTKLSVGSTLSNGTVDLYKFKVTASDGDIGLAKFVFGITTTSVTVASVDLYDVTDSNNEVQLFTETLAQGQNFSYLQATINETTGEVGNGTIKERTVADGATKTYILRGVVSGASSGDSISTVMAGDAAAHIEADSLMDTTTVVDADANDDFIWSDRSAGGHATTTEDWVNGYLVSGLNSTSSTASVVSL